MRILAISLHRKLGDDANTPSCILTEPRFGYRMPTGETAEPVDR